jgi:hypothetical protein
MLRSHRKPQKLWRVSTPRCCARGSTSVSWIFSSCVCHRSMAAPTVSMNMRVICGGPGESNERLDGLAGWRDSPYFSEPEKAALEWAESLTHVDMLVVVVSLQRLVGCIRLDWRHFTTGHRAACHSEVRCSSARAPLSQTESVNGQPRHHAHRFAALHTKVADCVGSIRRNNPRVMALAAWCMRRVERLIILTAGQVQPA